MSKGENMDDREAYRKLYGDLVYYVEKYYPKQRKMTKQEILQAQAMQKQLYSMYGQQQLGHSILGNIFNRNI